MDGAVRADAPPDRHREVRSAVAIQREKQLKLQKRKAKLALIEAANPQWKDLYEQIVQPERSVRVQVSTVRLSDTWIATPRSR